MALFGGRGWGDTESFGRRDRAAEGSTAHRVDGYTQFLAITERQAEFAEISIGQGWKHRRVDLLGAKEFSVLP